MEVIELDSFFLEQFNVDDMMHRNVSVLLDNDSDFHDYVGETQDLVESAIKKQEKGLNDRVYVVRNKEGYIGIISLIILEDKPYIAMGIVPEKKGRHFGKNLLKEYIEYIFSVYPDYGEICSTIDPENEISINNVLKLGFNQVSRTKYVKSRE